MAIRKFSDIGQAAETDGAYWYSYVTKTALPSPVVSGVIIDFNQSTGTPKYNPFAGSELTATTLTGSGNGGIYTGPDIPGRVKHLVRMNASARAGGSGNSTPPNIIWLNDYLMFYPLIDGDETGLQTMVNTQTLPRYTTGEGVRIVLIASSPLAATSSITVTYTNAEGVTGRTVTTNLYIAPSLGVCCTTAGTTGAVSTVTPFLPLGDGCTGVRSIESVQLSAAAGGFIVAALVKPITQLSILEDNVPSEINFGFDRQGFPVIQPGAYLNMMTMRGNTAANPVYCELVVANV